MNKFLALVILTLFFLLPASLAADMFGVNGHSELEGYNSEPESAKNIENWPKDIIDSCQNAQDNAIAACLEASLTRNPGGWWVHRLIGAKSYSNDELYNGSKVNVNVKDFIVGKWDCPPHNLLVDESGNYIDQEYIYNEFSGKMDGQGELKVLCDIGCGAWSCPLVEDTNPFKDCADYIFVDLLGDGIEDNTQETIEKFIDNKVEEEDIGIRALCEWQDGCELVSYELGLTVPVASSEDEYAVRICSKCSCEGLVLEPNYPQEVSSSSSLTDLVEGLSVKINENMEVVPSWVRRAFLNERVNIIIEGEDEAISVITGSEGISKVGSQIEDPTYNVYISSSLISETNSSQDYRSTILGAYESGKIKIEPVGFRKTIKIWFVDLIISFY